MFLEDMAKAIFTHVCFHMADVNSVLAIHQDYVKTHYAFQHRKRQIYIVSIPDYIGNLWRNTLCRSAHKTDPIVETLLCLLLYFNGGNRYGRLRKKRRGN